MSPTKHLLFKRVAKAEGVTVSFGYMSLSSWFTQETKEFWQEEQPEEKKKEKRDDALEFVAVCDSPKDVAARVRKDPLSKFVLLSGTMHEISVALPVFIGGKAAATMDKEWA